jgi:hypothetical protein
MDFWLLVRSIQSNAPDGKTLLARIESEIGKLPIALTRPYLQILEALKASF